MKLLPTALLLAAYLVPPGQEAIVVRMLSGPPLPGACLYDGARIEASRILGRYTCGEGPSSRVTVELSHPGPDPQAPRAEPPGHGHAPTTRTERFGLRVIEGEVAEGFLDALAGRVRAGEAGFRFTEPAPPSRRGEDRPLYYRARNLGVALGLSVLVVGLPILLGRAVARALGRLRRRGRIAAHALGLLVAVGAVGLPGWLVLRRPFIGLFDLAFILVLYLGALAVGLAPRATPRPAGNLGLALVSTLVALGGAEVFMRFALPALGHGAPMLRLLQQPEEIDLRARPLFPDRYGVHLPRAPGTVEPSGVSASVMHLGDSMLESPELSRGGDAIALLGRLRPAESHWNLGVSAVGTDYELALFRAHRARLHPALVVLHVFAGNDVGDLDAPFVFCDGGPLIDETPALASRCPSPRFSLPLLTLFRASPLPLPLRLLAQPLRLFAAIEERLRPRADFHTAVAPTKSEAARLIRLGKLVRALRAEAEAAGARFVVVLLPTREGVVVQPPGLERERVRAALVAAGIDLLDAAPDFAAAMRARPSARWFQPEPGNPHFDEAGQAFYADWPDQRLPHLIAASAPRER